MASYNNLNKTATTTEQFEPLKFNKIVLMENSDTTNDLIISLGAPISDGNYYVLKPGEAFDNLDIKIVSGIYYKSSASNVNFRFYTLLS